MVLLQICRQLIDTCNFGRPTGTVVQQDLETEFRSVFDGRKLPVLFVLYPTKAQIEDDEARSRELLVWRRTLSQWRQGARFLDLAKVRYWTPDLYIDPIHVNAEGQKRLATAIADHLGDADVPVATVR